MRYIRICEKSFQNLTHQVHSFYSRKEDSNVFIYESNIRYYKHLLFLENKYFLNNLKIMTSNLWNQIIIYKLYYNENQTKPNWNNLGRFYFLVWDRTASKTCKTTVFWEGSRGKVGTIKNPHKLSLSCLWILDKQNSRKKHIAQISFW